VRWRSSRSLAVRLAWRLCVLQSILLILAMFALTFRIFDERATYIDDEVTNAVSSSILTSTPQGPVFAPTEALQRAKQKYPALWAAAADEAGHMAVYGNVPSAFQGMAPQLLHLETSELHPSDRSEELGMRIVTEPRGNDRLHIMLGGAPRSGMDRLFVNIVRYLSPYFLLPLIFLTIITVPLVIVRATRGVRHVADQAAAIDISRPGAALEDNAVPREIQPLVVAFNTAVQRLREGYQARDRFLVDAAHELRMPIAILETRIGGMSEAPLKSRLLTDLGRLSTIAEQLLDLQRLGHPNAKLVPLDLCMLVRDVTSDVAPLVLAAGYALSYRGADSGVMVLGHDTSLSRVVTNLIQNAIVHAGGSGLIEITVTASGLLEVRDEGAGIPAGEEERIFRPFYRSQTTRDGHGLGLHLAQEIVVLHGGRIRVTNAAGGGAVFAVQLKLAGPA
jgi:two-component system sensor histidine kinase TctE